MGTLVLRLARCFSGAVCAQTLNPSLESPSGTAGRGSAELRQGEGPPALGPEPSRGPEFGGDNFLDSTTTTGQTE